MLKVKNLKSPNLKQNQNLVSSDVLYHQLDAAQQPSQVPPILFKRAGSTRHLTPGICFARTVVS